jgi:hypothetical protein
MAEKRQKKASTLEVKTTSGKLKLKRGAAAAASSSPAVKAGARPAEGGIKAGPAPAKEGSAVFAALSEISLPELPRENRARLQMQSPNRLFFYWSLKKNPYQALGRVVGDGSGYSLVRKLIDLDRGVERLWPAEPEGSAWFDSDSDTRYRAEIGFFATNRPYVRILYSNTLETPRKAPSPRPDSEAEWHLSADKFARVLHVAGFSQDAFEVAVAGDDRESADAETWNAFVRLTGAGRDEVSQVDAGRLRFAMLTLATGTPFSELRWHLDASVARLLDRYSGRLSSAGTLDVLKESFAVSESDDESEDDVLDPSAVFGASRVGFPSRFKKRPFPISSTGPFRWAQPR